MPRRCVSPEQANAAAELLDYVEFGPDGELAYVDSNVGTDAQLLLLALCALRSLNHPLRARVESAVEELEAALAEAP